MKSTKIFVRLDKKFQDETKTKSGVKFFVDPTIRSEWHVTCFGEVVTAPERINSEVKIPVLKGDLHPKIGENDARPYQEKDIEPEVQVGDRIYFRYKAIFEKDPILIDGELLFQVPYSDVFCVIRDTKIIPIGSHTFLDPLKEDKVKSDIIIIPETLKAAVSVDKARVVAIGSPLKGARKPDVEPGDIVVYGKGIGEKYKIEDEEYVVVRQDDLMIKL